MLKRYFLKSLVAVLFIMVHAAVIKAQTPDPGLMGPHAVLKAEYNLGDAYFPSIPTYFTHTMEARGSVHYPADLTSGPFPVLFWLHGRHETCYNPSTLSSYSAWPCNPGDSPIVSYEGYDYAATTMASHGYIVISVSANSINAHDAASVDDGMTARGHLLQEHMDLWNGWNTTVTTGPFGSLFTGRLDMQNIGTMGHSRGGEGVIYNAEYNRSLGSPYGIKAVLTLAPVDFYRHVLNKIPLMNIAPYCDGDVSDLEGVHFYDDARYKDSTDETPKHNLLVMGANHDFFNTVWTPGSYPAGGADDWADYGYSPFDPYCGTTAAGRLDTTKQKAVYNTYAAAFYRYYLGHETAFAPILQAKDLTPPASSLVDTSHIFMSYHPGRTDRFDINRIDSVYNLTTNNIGGSVTTTSLSSPAICGGGVGMPVCDIGLYADQRPHRGSSSIKGVAQMKLTWTDTTGIYQNDIPATYQDFSTIEGISFRACENFSEITPGSKMNFSVQLVDSAGNTSSLPVNNYTHAMFYQPGTEAQELPKVLFNTIRIPVADFTGVNIAKIRHIRFKFNRISAGAILVTDLALINEQCGKFGVNFTHSPLSGFNVSFTNSTQSNYGDTVTYLWHFGNPASGIHDTSTLASPTHLYTGSGAYTVCLYVTDRRRNGTVCTDTICTNITVTTSLVQQQSIQPITIIPNPAKDYLQINGAQPTDVLKLINVYGQEVLSTTISQPVITLPASLPAGLYYAVVLSPSGNVYQKILINR